MMGTCGEQIFRDRQVLFFIDNTDALSTTVNGCSKSPHLTGLSNTLHLSMTYLKCQSRFEWVPSDANPVDIPSRGCGEDEQIFYEHHGFVAIVFTCQFRIVTGPSTHHVEMV